MIAARGLVKSFEGKTALKNVDLTIERGEMFGLIGPDGAGKTTFFRIVAGLLAPTSGTLVRDPDVTFGFVPQRFAMYEDLSIDENLTLRARLYDVPKAEAKARSADLLARVGLERFGKRLAGALSGGMKQKLALVAALLTRPQLLLLDEPTTGVDPVSRREFWSLLNELHHDGLTILVSTPYMDEAEYASRIGFLDEGRLSALGTREEILAAYSRDACSSCAPRTACTCASGWPASRGRRRVALRHAAPRPRGRVGGAGPAVGGPSRARGPRRARGRRAGGALARGRLRAQERRGGGGVSARGGPRSVPRGARA